MQNNQSLLNNSEAAAYLGVTEGTLTVWRSCGRYNLPFVKVGRLVRYRLTDLNAFLDSRTQTKTA
ncbi:helix-turn-helix domain-containing protein [Shewanella sp. NIFS-20-20]|uniref:helix-turn-helix domain-containing protein n=1 Tax=Shewanella sp. NIFS-20-20 TaxID=2853806 RepID=UPI001C45D906|nr:helix-turn-helix domain-containing protein [Shewanella sp. NIFS-20-20]MBV7314754.1 helix-turn-helix domain-containing protein [Shewanella sp. NIFS-20-20]